MSKRDNKCSYKLQLRLSNSANNERNWRPSSIEEILTFVDGVVKAVNRKPEPALIDCPSYDGECKKCKPCVCYEYF